MVAGLGNPGSEYAGTRHNLGYDVIARLAREFRIGLGAGRGDFLSGRGRIGGKPALLLVPLTFMNESGRAIEQALDLHHVAPADLIVVCDDVNLPLGQLRVRRCGSEGGHNGLSSIIERLGSEGFPRLRLGIGRPPSGVDRADYVLTRFRADETPEVETMLDDAVDAIVRITRDGFERTMSIVNQRRVPADSPDSEEA